MNPIYRLTQKDIEIISAHFAQNAPAMVCATCKGIELVPHNGICHIPTFAGREMQSIQGGITALPIVCKSCGLISFFSAPVLGLLASQKDFQSPPAGQS